MTYHGIYVSMIKHEPICPFRRILQIVEVSFVPVECCLTFTRK